MSKITHQQKAKLGARKSAAHLVVLQAKKNDVNLKVKNLPLTRVEYEIDASGDATLIAVMPRNSGNEPYRYNLSFMLSQPYLHEIFSDAFIKWAARVEHTSRGQQVILLRNGFFAYLNLSSVQLKPNEIDEEVLGGYRDWLMRRMIKGRSLHAATIGSYLGSIRELLSSLRAGPFAAVAQKIAQQVPSGIRGAGKRSTPTEVLSRDELSAIIKASEREILNIERRWKDGGELIARGREMLRCGLRDYSDRSICLAALANTYSGVIPANREIFVNDNRLGEWSKSHGMKMLSGYFYPSARDLVGFVLLISINAVYNPDTVLKLRYSMIERDVDRAGAKAIKITGIKKRASKDLVRLLDPNESVSGELCLNRLLDLLELITSRIRGVADAYADWLFIFVPENKAKRVAAFESKCGRATNINWQTALKNFCTDNELPNFTLRQIRMSIIDMVQLGGGLEEAAAVGNHGNVTTTWNHYTSDGVKKRNRQAIAEILLLRDRWVATSGAVDPRHLMADQHKGAATPGFLCVDPLNPPRATLKVGGICSDYGGCPSCELAVARPTNAISVAYYLALRKSLFNSQSQMSSQTWLKRWAVNLLALNNLLSNVDDEVLRKALKIKVSLPNVG